MAAPGSAFGCVTLGLAPPLVVELACLLHELSHPAAHRHGRLEAPFGQDVFRVPHECVVGRPLLGGVEDEPSPWRHVPDRFRNDPPAGIHHELEDDRRAPPVVARRVTHGGRLTIGQDRLVTRRQERERRPERHARHPRKRHPRHPHIAVGVEEEGPSDRRVAVEEERPRVVELAEEQYEAMQEESGARARVLSLDMTATGARTTVAAFEQALATVYREPEHAYGAYLRFVDEHGLAAANTTVREHPEQFGAHGAAHGAAAGGIGSLLLCDLRLSL